MRTPNPRQTRQAKPSTRQYLGAFAFPFSERPFRWLWNGREFWRGAVLVSLYRGHDGGVDEDQIKTPVFDDRQPVRRDAGQLERSDRD